MIFLTKKLKTLKEQICIYDSVLKRYEIESIMKRIIMKDNNNITKEKRDVTSKTMEKLAVKQ